MSIFRPGRGEASKRLSDWAAPAAVGLLYAVAVVLLLAAGMRQTDGRLVYPLDDSYIHMSMAKNFALHHVWGISPYGFSSSTTSPLWTALLAAGYMLTGPNAWLPLALNIIAGIAMIVVLFRLLRREAGLAAASGMLLAVVLAASLPALTLLGMEHLLHSLLTVLFVHWGAWVLEGSDPNAGPNRGLILTAAVLPMIRYEGLFAVGVVGLCLLLRRRFRTALLLGIASAVPLALYGAFSMAEGWYALPNSVLLKGQLPRVWSFAVVLEWLAVRPAGVLWRQKDLLAVALLALGTFSAAGRFRRPFGRRRWFVVLFLAILSLHLLFAQVGWLYRYEAYLVVLGLMAASGGFPLLVEALRARRPPRRFLRRPVWAVGAVLLLLLPLGLRAVEAARKTPMAMGDRYLEHIQPARFVQACYPRAVVVANDIGALSYFTDCRLLDLYGLGSMEPIRLRFGESGFGRREVLDWTRREKAEIAILQIQWREAYSRIPREWILVALWHIPRNVVWGDTRIALFSTRADTAPVLAKNIAEYASLLPAAIRVERVWTDPSAGPAQSQSESGGAP